MKTLFISLVGFVLGFLLGMITQLVVFTEPVARETFILGCRAGKDNIVRFRNHPDERKLCLDIYLLK